MRRSSRAVLAGLALASASAASPARAEAPEESRAPLVRAGAMTVTVDRLLPIVSHTRQTVSWSEGSVGHRVEDAGTSFAFVGREPSLGSTHATPRLAVDVGLGSGLTLGTSVAFAVGVASPHVDTRTSAGVPDVTRENDAPRGSLFGFGPRVGWALPVARSLVVWPRAGFSFYTLSTTTEESSSAAVVRTETTDTLWSLDVDAQLAWSPFEHVVVLGGPLVVAPLMGAHATELSQGGIVKERSDQLRVWHLGLSLALGVAFDL